MKEKENDEKQKKLFQLLRELASVQNENMRLSFGIHARNLRSAAKDNVSKVTNGVIEGAKKMGRGAQKLADDYVAGKNGKTALKDYEAKIAELEAEYEDGIKGIRDEIARLEVQEAEQNTELNEIGQKRTAEHKRAEEASRNLKDIRKKIEELVEAKEKLQNGETIANATSSLSDTIERLKKELENTKQSRKKAIDEDDRKADRQGRRKQIKLNRKIKKFTRAIDRKESKEKAKIDAEIARLDEEFEKASLKKEEYFQEFIDSNNKFIEYLDKGNEIRNKISQTREQIKKYKGKEEEYSTYAVDTLTEISNLKNLANEQKAIMPKQNVFQRMFGFMVHNFNSAAKFTSNVMAPIGTATKRIVTEEIPKAGKVGVRVGKQTINGIANKYQDIKANMISKAEAKLEAKKGKNQELKATKAEQLGIIEDEYDEYDL